MSGSFADIGRTAFKLGTQNAVNETAKNCFPFTDNCQTPLLKYARPIPERTNSSGI